MHWQAAISGLPINSQVGSAPSVLFIRRGALWITTTTGTDPGSITVDRDVRSAALSPDGVSAAYVAASRGSWSVRTVCSGCLAQTILSGTGPAPAVPVWSPEATRIATVQGTTLYVAGTTGNWSVHWLLPRNAQFLGWAPGGQSILLWSAATHRVELRSLSGRRLRVWPGTYMHRPSLSADGTSVARTRAGRVWIRAAGRRWTALPGTRGCSPGAWSTRGTRLLVTCPGSTQIWSGTGRLIAQPSVAPSAGWAPGSSTALLYFAQGGLWRWDTGANPTEIVTGARSPQ